MSSFGASQKLRQQRLGHADGSPATETIYTHMISEDVKRIAAQLLAIEHRRHYKYADDLTAKWFWLPARTSACSQQLRKIAKANFVAAVRFTRIPGAKHCTATTYGMDADLTPSTNIVAAGILS